MVTTIINKVRNFRRQFYRVPYCVPAWGWAEHWAILRCLLTGRLIEGADKEELYDRIREKTGVKYVFGFNSGREAIQAALQAKKIGAGDQVIMPSYCCETVARAIIDCGAKPLFCDIGDDYNPDVPHILKIFTPSVKAIIFPHLFGNPGAIDRLERELEESGVRSAIFLIDDAAQSFGAKLNHRLIGTFGDAGVISFGPGKTMTASGGGLLLTNSETLAKALPGIELGQVFCRNKLLRLVYWVIFRRWRRYSLPFYRLFQGLFSDHGTEAKPTKLCNVDAAIALEQVRKLDSLLRVRIERKKELDKRVSDLWREEIILPAFNGNPETSLRVATKYVFRLRHQPGSNDRQQMYRQFLLASGIELQSLYEPIHLKSEHVPQEGPLVQTESVWGELLQIPLEPSMGRKQFEFVIKAVDEFKECLY